MPTTIYYDNTNPQDAAFINHTSLAPMRDFLINKSELEWAFDRKTGCFYTKCEDNKDALARQAELMMLLKHACSGNGVTIEGRQNFFPVLENYVTCSFLTLATAIDPTNVYVKNVVKNYRNNLSLKEPERSTSGGRFADKYVRGRNASNQQIPVSGDQTAIPSSEASVSFVLGTSASASSAPEASSSASSVQQTSASASSTQQPSFLSQLLGGMRSAESPQASLETYASRLLKILIPVPVAGSLFEDVNSNHFLLIRELSDFCEGIRNVGNIMHPSDPTRTAIVRSIEKTFGGESMPSDMATWLTEKVEGRFGANDPVLSAELFKRTLSKGHRDEIQSAIDRFEIFGR